MLKRTTISTLTLAFALVASNAQAQDAPANPAPETPAEASTETTTPAAAEAAAVVTEEPVEEEEAAPKEQIDPNDPLYWAKLRDIYTVQKRAFQKQGRFAISAYGGLIPNNQFEKYIPVGVRVNYFILENLGLELAGSYAFKMDTNLQSTLQEPTGAAAQQVLVGDTQISHTNFGILWSPFYGKTAFYDSALNYFDLYLFAGAGLVITETVPDFNAPAESEAKPEGALGAGLAFYLGTNATLRVDFRQFVFQKVEGVGGVANPSEVSLGFGWFF